MKYLGIQILRLGLAGLFLWFGFTQIFDSANWVGWVPNWATELVGLPAVTIVLVNGIFEIVFGALLALNFFTPVVAFILAIHTFVIAFDIGFSEIGIRDLAIAISALALALLTYRGYQLNQNAQ